MQALSAQLLDQLRRDRSGAEALQRVGEPDPQGAARAFLRAARHPDLAASVELWAPALLASARPGHGARCLIELAEARRGRGDPPLDPARTPTLPRLLGSSNFLARLLQRRPDWVRELEGELPRPPDSPAPEPDWQAIRQHKYRGLLRIAARDLASRPFADGLRELSVLADGCLAAALTRAADDSGSETPSLFALGKLGGSELNFSSDVDLLFVFDPPPRADAQKQLEAVTRVIQRLKRELETPSADGFAYRVDLDLRPEGRSGVLANSVDAALSYYESFGAEWERQMLIRLRPVAGPTAPADDFERGILPFVYRRFIDPGVMHRVRDMKARIEEERRRSGRDIELEVKEGPGGIRDVEFLVQSLQLFHGGRQPTIRTGNVLSALAALERCGLLSAATTADLHEAYLFLRRVEHALQLVEEQQTARFPSQPNERIALARRMGYAHAEAPDALARLMDDWTSVRSRVRAHFEALVLREKA
jgi:glutamate-ammonia-ligase adenylyltransferase